MSCGAGAAKLAKPVAPTAAERNAHQCTGVTERPTAMVMLGKSRVIPLKVAVTRVVVDAPVTSKPPPGAAAGPTTPGAAPAPQMDAYTGIADADVLLLSPTDLFVRGRRAGSMNVILQDAKGACYLQDIVVSIDPGILQSKLAEVMPEEADIHVKSAENALVLTGRVNDPAKLDEVMRIATAYGDGKRVVNLLRVSSPQQVMLEVKIAEVSKSILDHLNIDYSRMFVSADGMTSKVLSGLFGGVPIVAGKLGRGTVTGAASVGVSAAKAGVASSLNATGNTSLFGIDAQKQDGVVRVLAEPNIMAISGQSASFLSGGKIFIPVSQNQQGLTTITLEEKEFGVGLKFSPTVLDGSRVNLKVVSEVSELSQTGSPFTTIGNFTAVLPSMTTRRVDTTVQLNDGQSFAIAGLIRNNVTETLKKFPGLGDIPVLGTLFRSSEFQKDQTELLFVITPRLVKPTATAAVLPTDIHAEPSRTDAMIMGTTEAKTAQPAK
ncbi:BON domain-containing protein [Massilia terrae]|uniref:BON domain-containing protein n=2 Tax=Massilia terrae TaxID=1811224 RepID=A0ABT2CZD9_9BURK|nr:BON domain-containing protein [Massilia terrae]MCS0658550.1 BON domain-containing protein [Massilia terrae]